MPPTTWDCFAHAWGGATVFFNRAEVEKYNADPHLFAAKHLKEKRANRNKYFLWSYQFDDFLEEINERSEQWINRAQSILPAENIFQPMSKGEVARALTSMVTTLNISVKAPEVYITQLTASVFAKEPNAMTMLATVREITETFSGKDLQVSDALRTLAKHQQRWSYWLDDLKAWRSGGIKAKLDETAAAVKEAIDAAKKLLIFNLVGVRPGLANKI